jgi:hypothetical protein
MTNEILAQGLANDRYLKAVQLIEQFETALHRELKQAGKQIVTDNPERFVDDGYPNHVIKQSHSKVIAHQRIDYTMDRVDSPGGNGSNLKLNLGFRWVEPGKFGEETTGALSAVTYRIKNGSDDEYQSVIEDTRNDDWDVKIADDPFGSYPATFYVPVETAEEIQPAYDALAAHFKEFGDQFGHSN